VSPVNTGGQSPATATGATVKIYSEALQSNHDDGNDVRENKLSNHDDGNETGLTK
jgi:hypothetical protein